MSRVLIVLAFALGCDYVPSDDERLCWSLGPQFRWQIVDADTTHGLILVGKALVPYANAHPRYACVNTKPKGSQKKKTGTP